MVEDVHKRNRVMESVHNSSHFGINCTLDLVSSKYHWPGLTNDVEQYVSTYTCTWLHMYVSCVLKIDLHLIMFFRFTCVIYVEETMYARS